MTSDQALSGLLSIVGGGGLSAVLVAVVGYLTEVRKGRKIAEPSLAISIGDPLAMKGVGLDVVDQLATISATLIRLAAIKEIEAEERFAGKDFSDRLEGKEMHVLRDVTRR